MENKRLKEIDFLRGVAIILVLFRHHTLTSFTENIGWIGVDLFFVLSGFLVSGVLFKEFIKYGNVDSVQFLIRRGFKIYPAYFFFLVLTVFTTIVFNEKMEYDKLLYDAIFASNYMSGVWAHFWSLCVEEHFYIFLSILIPLLIRLNIINRPSYFIIGIICLLIGVFLIKFIGLYFFSPKNIFRATHYRFDSLLSGVLTGYLYYFKLNSLKRLFFKFEKRIMMTVLILISFSPFLNHETNNDHLRFVGSFGLVFLYVAFNLLLIYFLFKEGINNKLEHVFGKYIVMQVANIGLYSYGIYIFHLYVLKYIITPLTIHTLMPNGISFIIYFFLSIFLGIIFSKIIEIPFLSMRDKYFQRK